MDGVTRILKVMVPPLEAASGIETRRDLIDTKERGKRKKKDRDRDACGWEES